MHLQFNIFEFIEKLIDWFSIHQRNLPWRKTYEPYHIWISEIMLQQTQMERGVEYFNRWMKRFPDIARLAGASEQSVLKTWEGLGYYSRARNIMKTASILMEEYNGKVPEDYDVLLTLPGIGPYTAGAIMSIAFDHPFPVIDANVERLFARIGDIDRPMKHKDVYGELWQLLENMVRETSPRLFNQGLMELGAMVCTPRNPDCGDCPVREHCQALQKKTVVERPVKTKQQEKIDIIMACTIISASDGRYFIQQRHYDDIWGGLWEFPGGRLKNGESSLEAARRELYEETGLKAPSLAPFATVTHYYTKYRVTLHSFFCSFAGTPRPELHAARQGRWVTLEEMADFAFPSGHRQLVARMKKVADSNPD